MATQEHEWFLLLGPDGTTQVALGGAPSAWVGKRLAELSDAPAPLKETAARLLHEIHAGKGGQIATSVVSVGPARVRLALLEAVVVHRAPTDVRALIVSATEVLQRQAAPRDITLTVRVDESVPKRVSVDAEMIAWALTTLVGNALRHVRVGNRRLPGGSIEVTVASQDGLVRVDVRDDGPGIPSDKLPYLFERPPGATHAVGLSLSLVKDIVAAHGGSVEVHCATGKFERGTTISLLLPTR